MSEPIDETTQWPVLAAEAASSKMGTDPVILDVGDVLSITDHFVIVSGANTRQVRTIAEEIERQITDAGGPKPLRTEGLDDLRWVLLDYGAFVVHVFLQEAREYYELERLWSDVPRVDFQASIHAVTTGSKSAGL
jgi:ribosome-associated protein